MGVSPTEKRNLILAFESSCDETSVAVIEDGHRILSNIVATQIKSHQRFGGVVPEVASRHHIEEITLCIEDALAEAQVGYDDLTAVAVTYGPGLVGALLIGVTAAKTVAFAHNLPLIPVNHMAGHIYAPATLNQLNFQLWRCWYLAGTRNWFTCRQKINLKLLVKRATMPPGRLMIKWVE